MLLFLTKQQLQDYLIQHRYTQHLDCLSDDIIIIFIIMLNIRKFVTTSLLTNHLRFFSNNLQLMQFQKKKGVLDLKQLTYTPKQKLQFLNDQCLIYQNKQGMLTNWYLFSHLTITSAYTWSLMFNNPWYLTFPASLPLMFVFQVFLFRRWYLKQKRYRPIVSQIHLITGGHIIKVTYANTITRKLKDLQMHEYFYVTGLKTPILTQDDMPFTGEVFPTEIDKIDPALPFSYAWTKYYGNRQNHLMIPRRYDYANMEVLIEVFKGKLINC